MKFDVVVKKTIKDVTRFLKKNRSPILTGVSIVGFGTTVYLAVKATPAACMDYEDAKFEAQNEGREFRKIDGIKAAGKHYIPAAIAGAGTIACMIINEHKNSQALANVTTAYAILDKQYTAYKEKVVEELGAKKERKIEEKKSQAKVDALPPISLGEVICTGKGQQIGVDSYGSDRRFFTSYETLRRAENDLNKEILDEGYASLNYFYGLIGLPDTGVGDEMGWTRPVDFVRYLSTTWCEIGGLGRVACIDIDFPFDDRPRWGYQETWVQ